MKKDIINLQEKSKLVILNFFWKLDVFVYDLQILENFVFTICVITELSRSFLVLESIFNIRLVFRCRICTGFGEQYLPNILLLLETLILDFNFFDRTFLLSLFFLLLFCQRFIFWLLLDSFHLILNLILVNFKRLCHLKYFTNFLLSARKCV